ncbi:MAG: helix-turn-helix domain-containing protein [bacterium]|nr:helix-turn-helix domain-containing protein [bacterium]
MTQSDPKQALLDAAARETLQSIKKDRESAPVVLQPVLARIEESIFSPGFDVHQLKQACGIRPQTIELFRSELGCLPAEYIRDRRLRTAAKLLRETSVRAWRIAEFVGYSGIKAFGVAFRRWAGRSARSYRRAWRTDGAMGLVPAGESDTVQFWRRAATGTLEPEEAAGLIERLREKYPQPEGLPFVARFTLRDESYERLVVEMVWNLLEAQPWEEQRKLVRNHISCGSPALFELLLANSREQGNVDRERGIRLAELAMDCLDGSAKDLGDELPMLRVRGWAWVANARRLALDLQGAEEAFAAADAEWRGVRETQGGRMEAELYDLKATLRMFQYRFDEALALNRNAIDLLRSLGHPILLAQSLMLRATIHENTGETRAIARDLREALELLSEQEQPALMLTAYKNLADACSRTGDYEEGSRILSRAKALSKTVDSKIIWYELHWIEGLLHQGRGDLSRAASSLQEARVGLSELAQRERAAMASLDLAIVYVKQDRFSEVLALASEAIPVLEGFKTHRQASPALKVLCDAIADDKVSLVALLEVRACLDRILRDPRVRVAEEGFWFGCGSFGTAAPSDRH